MSGEWPLDVESALKLQTELVAATRVQLEKAGLELTRTWAVVVIVDPDPAKGSIKLIG